MENPEAESGSSSMSLKRDDCEDQLIYTEIDQVGSTAGLRENSRPDPSCVSLRSDHSRDWLIHLKKSSTYFRDKDLDVSKNEPMSQLDSIFKCLEEKILTFVKDQLKRFHRVIALDYPECLVSEEDDEQSSREAFLKITVDFLKRMDQEQLAERLQKKNLPEIQCKLKSHLQHRFSCVFERNPTLLNQIYTELYITEGGATGVNQEHEVRHTETASRKPAATTITCEEIFEGPAHRPGPIRTELTEAQGPIREKLKERKGPIRAELAERQAPIRRALTERQRPITAVLLEGQFRTKVTEGRRPIRTELTETQGPIREELTERKGPIRAELAERQAPIRRALTERQRPITAMLLEGQFRTKVTEGRRPIRTELTETQGPIRTELTETQGPIKSKLTKLVGKLRPQKTMLKKAHRPIRAELTEEQGPIRTIRTVLTKGVAGIGKTVLTQKFSLDWAEGRANQDIQLLFPFTFRELNVLRDRQFSLVGLLQLFFKVTAPLCDSEHLQVVFILDGLDECRLPLDFTKTRVLTEATESVSVDVLLVNLIKGTLLPSAHIWITTRPSAANQIPAECISMLTELRGFNDPQREEYIMKTFTDEEQARAIISHIKTSHSLHIMCHIPVFCWIISTVLQHVMETRDRLPQTLTQIYIHFLVVQVKVKSHKYEGCSEMDPHWTPKTRKMVKSLGKLAFEQLQKGNLIFYESDLIECGLDPTVASVYSGVFTQVFREEPGLYQDKVYCFIHLSVQEFLAALHVHFTLFNSGVNLLSTEQTSESPESEATFYCSAVDQALQSPNGHLDLFLRFLLGLSLPTNQNLLRGLLAQTGSEQTVEETVEYICIKLDKYLSAESSMNLFHCLNELNDCSLVKNIQMKMREGGLCRNMSPAQWSVVAFLLLSSDTDLEEFDMNKYHVPGTALPQLLPVIKASTKAILSGCGLSKSSCGPLSSVLSSSSVTLLDLSNNDLQDSGVKLLCSGLKSASCRLKILSLSWCFLSPSSCGPLSSVLSSSSLTHLDLSNNDLLDSGVELLSSGLMSAPCRLEILRLSGCLVSKEGGASLASALSSAHLNLRELDLSYNHLGPSAELLTALREDPYCILDTLRLKPDGVKWMTLGLGKYCCELILDSNTANHLLQLSENNRTVTCFEEEQQYLDHQDRFSYWPQILCSTGLTGRCYWEVEWSGNEVHIAVSFKGINRNVYSKDGVFGLNDQSWSLRISDGEYYVYHKKTETQVSSHFSQCGRVGVYLDSEAGSLSFYGVSYDGEYFHLHTFSSTFTEPLFPGFGLWPGSSVSLVTPDT